MLDRNAIKNGQKYLLNGQIVMVHMIHKPGNGESVTLCDPMPPGCHNPFPYLHKQTMQMRKFQRHAKTVEVRND